MPFLDRGDYERMMEEALLVAIPIQTDGKWAAGVTSLTDAMKHGKIVAITDREMSLADGLIRDGYNGLLVGAANISHWKQVIQHLASAGPDILRSYEQRVFQVARARLSREAIVDELQCTFSALRGGAQPMTSIDNYVWSGCQGTFGSLFGPRSA
eukprot:UN2638